MNRQEVDIVEIPKENIDEIEPLWSELNNLHHEKSSHFKDHFASSSFEDRCKKLLEMEKLGIFAAKSEGEYIGYCIASTNGGSGEIDSLYLKKGYRGKNLGKELIGKAMDWLNSHHCRELNVYVAEGNEAVLPFYEQFGFKKRFVVLQIRSP